MLAVHIPRVFGTCSANANVATSSTNALSLTHVSVVTSSTNASSNAAVSSTNASYSSSCPQMLRLLSHVHRGGLFPLRAPANFVESSSMNNCAYDRCDMLDNISVECGVSSPRWLIVACLALSLYFKQNQNFGIASAVVASVILKCGDPHHHNLIIHNRPYTCINNQSERMKSVLVYKQVYINVELTFQLNQKKHQD